MSQENLEFLESLFAGAMEMDKQALLDPPARVDRPNLRSAYRLGRGPKASRPAHLPGPRGRARVVGALA